MKLKEYLIRTGVVSSISHESIRKILKKEGISFQRTKTWMESNDPEFEVKKTEYLTSTPIRPKMGSYSASMNWGQLRLSLIPEVPGKREESQKEFLPATAGAEQETYSQPLRLKQAK